MRFIKRISALLLALLFSAAASGCGTEPEKAAGAGSKQG